MRDVPIEGLIRKILSARTDASSEACVNENTMAAYLERRLSPGEIAGFESHVSNCARCQEVLALSLKLQPDESETSEYATRASKKTLFRFSIPVPVLGALVLAVAITAVFFKFVQTPRKNPSDSQVAELHYASARSQQTQSETRNEALKTAEVEKRNSKPDRLGMEVRTREKKAIESAPAERITPEAPAAAALKAQGAPTEETGAQTITESEQQRMVAGLDDRKGKESSSADLKTSAPALKTQEAQALGTAAQTTAAAADSAKNEPAPPPARLNEVGAFRDMATNMAPMKDALLKSMDDRGADAADSKKVGDKVFVHNAGVWVDLECAKHKKNPIIEILPAVPEYEPILKQYPDLRPILPVLIHWKGKNYLLR